MFRELFTDTVDVVFAFHGYPGAVHQLVHGRPDADRFHVRGFIEEGTTTTPFDMVVRNRASRFHLVMDAINNAGRTPAGATELKAWCEAKLAEHEAYVVEHLEDMPRCTRLVARPTDGGSGLDYREATEGDAMTTNAEHSLDVLTRAIAQTEAVLASVPADHLSDPTPCIAWDVAALVGHVVVDPRNFVTMARGGEPDWSAVPELPDNWVAEFRSGADELLQHWRDAGDDASAQSMDWQSAEFAVHTWDLVQALSLPNDLDPEVAERGYGFMSVAMTPDNRGQAFGPAVPVPDDASAYERLVGFAGRNPF